MKKYSELGLIEIPEDIVTCPVCGMPVTILQIDEWESDGRATSDGILWVCSGEPDMTDFKYDAWHEQHYAEIDPVDWSAADNMVLEWFNANYRGGE